MRSTRAWSAYTTASQTAALAWAVTRTDLANELLVGWSRPHWNQRLDSLPEVVRDHS